MFPGVVCESLWSSCQEKPEYNIGDDGFLTGDRRCRGGGEAFPFSLSFSSGCLVVKRLQSTRPPF